MNKHSAPKITPIRKGQKYSRHVEGGFIQSPAPSDGLVLETEETSVFFPAEDVAAALALLGRR